MTKAQEREVKLEYRTKHPDCWYCSLRYITPCHSLRCEITMNCVYFTRLRARRCKHYTVEVE